MQIYEFLKVKKVKCIDVGGMCLTKDKEYQLLGVTDRSCMINDDEGYETWASMQRFEPVPNNDVSKSAKDDSAFKVGDKVYFPNIAEGEVLTLLDNKACHYPFFVNVVNRVNNSIYELDSNGKTKYGNFTDVVLKATQESYEMLCKLYPHIEFEFPPEPLTGNELCYLMLRGEHTNIMCQVDGDETNIRIITLYTSDYFYDRSGNRYSEVVPIDTKGVPLTEDVLNDIN